MKHYLAAAIFLLLTFQLQAQWTKQIAFPITSYIVNAGDSVTIIQVKLPQGFSIKEKTYGLVRSVFNSPGDSVITVGSGRCSLIKSEYCYYGLLNKYMPRKPVAGDLLYTDVTTPPFYTGYLFNVMRHNITINSVAEKTIADLNIILQVKTADDELPLLTVLADDVKYTGKVMSEQNNSQDMMIPEGRFKDQKLFAAMQKVTVADVKDFFKYINARPEKYASHTWKMSEIMATWMAGGTPTVRQ